MPMYLKQPRTDFSRRKCKFCGKIRYTDNLKRVTIAGRTYDVCKGNTHKSKTECSHTVAQFQAMWEEVPELTKAVIEGWLRL